VALIAHDHSIGWVCLGIYVMIVGVQFVLVHASMRWLDKRDRA
jgi:hypothetical protein